MALEPYCIDCDVEGLILTACLSQPWQDSGSDAISHAILSSLRQYSQAHNELLRHRLLDFEPFNPETKRMWALSERPDGEQVTCTIGAPKACLEAWETDNFCNSDKDDIKERFIEAATSLSGRGIRALGILRRRENRSLEVMGLLPLADDIRWDATSAVEDAHNLNISIKLITGDATVVAQEMTKKIGLAGEVLQLEGSAKNDSAPGSKDVPLDNKFEAADCFSEAFPEHKVEIVERLQACGHVVAITGDGLNDVPSLRLADYGIAVNGASERAQSAAKLLMLNPGISAIVGTIAAARRHFRLLETFLVHRTAVCVDLIATCYMWQRQFGEPLHPEYLFFVTWLDERIRASFSQDQDGSGAPIEKKPSKLISRTLFTLGFPLSVISIAMKACLLSLMAADYTRRARWVVYLSTILLNHSSFLVLYGRGYLWSRSFLRRSFLNGLESIMIALVLCMFSWPGDERPLYWFTANGRRLATASVLSTLYHCWFMWSLL